MLRKTILALAASATIGAAALGNFRIGLLARRMGWLVWRLARRLRLPARNSRLCRPSLRRLHGAALGLHPLRGGAPLGQSLLLGWSNAGCRANRSSASGHASISGRDPAPMRRAEQLLRLVILFSRLGRRLHRLLFLCLLRRGQRFCHAVHFHEPASLETINAGSRAAAVG